MLPSIIDINPIAIKRRGCVVLDIEMDFQNNGTNSDAHAAAVEPPSASCGPGAFDGSIRAQASGSVSESVDVIEQGLRWMRVVGSPVGR